MFEILLMESFGILDLLALAAFQRLLSAFQRLLSANMANPFAEPPNNIFVVLRSFCFMASRARWIFAHVAPPLISVLQSFLWLCTTASLARRFQSCVNAIRTFKIFECKMSFELLWIKRVREFESLAFSAFKFILFHVYFQVLSFWAASNTHRELHLSSGS